MIGDHVFNIGLPAYCTGKRIVRFIKANMEIRRIIKEFMKFANKIRQYLDRFRIRQAPTPTVRLKQGLQFRVKIQNRMFRTRDPGPGGMSEQIDLRDKCHTQFTSQCNETFEFPPGNHMILPAEFRMRFIREDPPGFQYHRIEFEISSRDSW